MFYLVQLKKEYVLRYRLPIQLSYAYKGGQVSSLLVLFLKLNVFVVDITTNENLQGA